MSDAAKDLYPEEIDEILGEIEPRVTPARWLNVNQLSGEYLEELKKLNDEALARTRTGIGMRGMYPTIPVMTYEDDVADKSIKMRFDMNYTPIYSPRNVVRLKGVT